MGCLWGLAWGDVLGVPVEGWSAGEIARVYGRYAGLPDAYPAGIAPQQRARLRPLGLHSDDTQQALALLAVCQSSWSADAWGRCLVDGAAKGAWRGTGRRFDASVQKLAKGAAPQQSGSASAGIGAAMRTGPLGALYRDRSRTLAEVAAESSAVTHADLRSIALGYAVAWTCAQLVNGKDAAAVRAELPDATAEVEDEWLHGRVAWSVDRAGRHQLALGLARVLACTTPSLAALAAHVVRLGSPYVDKAHLPAHASHAFSLLGGLFGLVAGLVVDEDPAAALVELVGFGEDTDTVAAIAGSVLGARFGHAWVPKHRVVDHARISAYAQALVQRDGAVETVDALLAHEATLTARARAFQASR